MALGSKTGSAAEGHGTVFAHIAFETGSADEIFYIGADGEAAIESDESESDQFDNELDKNERAMSCEW